MVSQVTSIQFGILSDIDIKNMSVCLINKPSLIIEDGSVYDKRLGCVQNDELCETCQENIWKCPGHFGHINLNIPIVLFYKQCIPMLKCFCFYCHRLLCSSEELKLNGVKGYEQTIKYVSKMTSCGFCNTAHPEIRFNIAESIISAHHKFKNEKTLREITPTIMKQVFDDISDDDVRLLCIDPTMFHPRNLVLTKFPVLPTCCRPRMITPDNISDDDLSIILVDIIKQNYIIENESENKEKYDKAIVAIKFRTLTYCDNSRGKAVHNTNHKPMTGIKERITKKTGHVRQNLMGKRCDKTARTVVGPEPTLKLNEVAVPPEIANILTIPEYVTPLSIEQLTKVVNENRASLIIKKNGTKISVPNATLKRGTHLQHGDIVQRDDENLIVTNCKMELKLNDIVTRNGESIPTSFPEKKEVKLDIGDKVERYLKDGDYVLLNRQPTLHRNSMQGMKVVIKPGKTLRLNLSIVAGYNMDFDGTSTWTIKRY